MENRTVFNVQLEDIEVRDSGAGEGMLTVRGHASVFNKLSHNLGGFREIITPGAFTDVLSDPSLDVHLVVDHDMSKPLARTRSSVSKLELREDPAGLHVWARIATQASYAKDVAEAMRTGLMDQMSFAFTTSQDHEEWEDDGEGNITRTIRKVTGLFDVSIVAQGAYPQTDVSMVRSLEKALESAIAEGRVANLSSRANQQAEIIACENQDCGEKCTCNSQEVHEGEDQDAHQETDVVEVNQDALRARQDYLVQARRKVQLIKAKNQNKKENSNE